MPTRSGDAACAALLTVCCERSPRCVKVNANCAWGEMTKAISRYRPSGL